MNLLQKILVLAAAVAIVLATVVLMPPRENPPAPPQPNGGAHSVGAIAPPDEVETTAALQNPAKSGTAASARFQSRPGEPVPTSTPTAKVVTPRKSEVPSVRGDAAGGPEAPGPVGETYVVKHGDTPATIALQHLGDASRWPEIARANPGLKATSLQVGQILRLPQGAAPAAAEVQAGTMAKKPTAAPRVPGASGAPLAIHRVGPGDSLYKLARKYYGDSSRWELIRDANPAMLGSGVSEMRLDSELIIPALPDAGQ
jgi:nucleoid-associated protein YgaU